MIKLLDILGYISGIIGIIGFLFNIKEARKRWAILAVVGVIVVVAVEIDERNEQEDTTEKMEITDWDKGEAEDKNILDKSSVVTTEREEVIGDIVIEAITQSELNIADIVQSVVVGESAYIEKYEGMIEKDGQENTYTIQSNVQGKCRIEISDLLSGVKINLVVYNEAGEKMDSTSYGIENGEGITIDGLVPYENYVVSVQQYSGYSNYVLTIGYPKKVVEITNYTSVEDRIEYTNQSNVYEFVPPVNGRYRFELEELISGVKVNIFVYNAGNEKEDGTSYGIGNGEGLTIEHMVAGEKYKVCVEQYNSQSSYKLLIGYQKAMVGDISSHSTVKDSIQYTDQQNIYEFVPPINGRYRFEMADLISGNTVNIVVYNQAGEKVDGTSYGIRNGEGITIDHMVEGETYQITVNQCSGYSKYKLQVGRQKQPVEIERSQKVSDSVEYTEQKNIYLFTPLETDDYYLKIKELTSGVKLNYEIFNAGGERIAGESYGVENGCEIEMNEMIAGETYEIWILQYEGMSEYILELR